MSSEIAQQTAVAVKATAAATYGASGTAFLFGMAANEFAALASLSLALVFGLANLALNIYYKRKHLELAREKRRNPPEEG